MIEMDEMKDVIEKVEKKLIASSQVYAGMNYIAWTVVLAVYQLILLGVYFNKGAYEWLWTHTIYAGIFMGLFWGISALFIAYINVTLWKKTKHLMQRNKKNGKGAEITMIAGWVIAGILFGVLPMMIYEPWSAAFSFLLFIISGNSGIAIGFRDYKATMPVITSLIAIPFIIVESIDASWFIAIQFVTVGYALSTILYLWNTFTLVNNDAK